MKEQLKNLIYKFPLIKNLKRQVDEYKRNSCYPPGHFYSPIVSVDKVKENEYEIWKGVADRKISGIDLNEEEQLSLVQKFKEFYLELPFQEDKAERSRYYFNNDYYRHTDAITLYSMIRHYKPKRIIEAGSGFSSAVMLDTRQYFLKDNLQLTFVEPYPERLFSLLTESDKSGAHIIVKELQKVDLSVFEELRENDILFIDSTHVSKTGSDVNYILFQILPRLNPGVLIHFHDVFYPFEYPKEWVLQGRNWNEDYLLRAFLLYNQSFKIKVFTDFLHKHHASVFSEMPLFYKNTGGSLWIQKL